jgi:hypothetical protein
MGPGQCACATMELPAPPPKVVLKPHKILKRKVDKERDQKHKSAKSEIQPEDSPPHQISGTASNSDTDAHVDLSAQLFKKAYLEEIGRHTFGDGCPQCIKYKEEEEKVRLKDMLADQKWMQNPQPGESIYTRIGRDLDAFVTTLPEGVSISGISIQPVLQTDKDKQNKGKDEAA